ncbi:fungal hydrophobin [Phlegmacium glaucopus]|nr:fungal hydrophobin [Phlegmacium glaucopus]
MFARSASIVLLALPLFASAALIRRGGSPSGGISNSCNTGTVQCCSSSQSATDSSVIKQLGLLGVAAPITGLVGFTCTPISALGSTETCTTHQICCDNDKFNAAVVVGCSPVNLGL